METWKDFLIEHAKFPFPTPDETRTANSTATSELEANRLDPQWKAKHAVRDDALVQKLCDTLDHILGGGLVPEAAKPFLLPNFSPVLRGDQWESNPNEAHVNGLLFRGFFAAASEFLMEYGPYRSRFCPEERAEGFTSLVDYVMKVDGEENLLVEAKSPSVMAQVHLPLHGIELTWEDRRSLVVKIITKVALYLAQRKLEWFFLTCHNYWVVFRLVRHDNHPFLVYSPKISIQDSSVPFRAFLGAILSGIKGVPVPPSVFDPRMQFDSIEEEEEKVSSGEEDDRDDSATYRGSSSKGHSGGRPNTCHAHNDSGLMITSSSPTSPESSRTWVDLYPFSNNTLALPQYSTNSDRRVWLTRIIGSGSTGDVWQCHFNNNTGQFALKIAEVLRRSDADRRQRLRHEFTIYQTLESAYTSGRLRSRVAPRCYGAFEGDHMDVLILDLCDGMLNAWDELNISERTDVYKLVQDLHSVGIVHGDLEPRNVVRVNGGGFRLIDFSESWKHACKESKAGGLGGPEAQKQKCRELQELRRLLWQPLQEVVNV